MKNLIILLLFFLAINFIQAQNIFSAIHLNDRYKIKYDKPIKKIESTSTFYNTNNTEKQKEIIFLNEKFRISKEERYNSDGELIFKTENEYRSDSLKIKNSTSRKIPLFGNEIIISLFEYDSNNYLTKIEKRNAKNQIIEIVFIENDNKGNPIYLKLNNGEYGYEKAIYDYSKNSYSTFVYNSNNELISSDKSIRFNFDIPTEDHKFNEYGDLVESKMFKFEYKYDKYGNWIKETRYKLYGTTKVKNAEITRKIMYK